MTVSLICEAHRFFLLIVAGKHIRNLADRNVGKGINAMNQLFHAYDLIAIDHKINHGFFFVGIAAFCIQIGDTASEYLTELAANFLWLLCDNDGAFCSVETIHNEIYGL